MAQRLTQWQMLLVDLEFAEAAGDAAVSTPAQGRPRVAQGGDRTIAFCGAEQRHLNRHAVVREQNFALAQKFFLPQRCGQTQKLTLKLV